MINREQNQRSDQGHKESGGLAGLIVTDRAADPSSEERACDADEHRDEDSARIFAGHDEFGECADNKTDNSRPK